MGIMTAKAVSRRYGRMDGLLVELRLVVALKTEVGY